MSRICLSRFIICLAFSSLAFSFVPHFHVSHFHDLHFRRSRIYISRIFSRPAVDRPSDLTSARVTLIFYLLISKVDHFIPLPRRPLVPIWSEIRFANVVTYLTYFGLSDFDRWPTHSQSWHFIPFCWLAAKSVNLFSNYHVHKIGSKRMEGWKGDEWPGRKPLICLDWR